MKQQTGWWIGMPLTDGTRLADYFEIRIDKARHCLCITMHGLWDDAVFNAFETALRAAEDEMRGMSGATYTLVNSLDFGVQDMALIERFPPLLASFGLDEFRRTAIVAPDTMTRMQARPAGEVVNARYFRKLEPALDWLFSDEA